MIFKLPRVFENVDLCLTVGAEGYGNAKPGRDVCREYTVALRLRSVVGQEQIVAPAFGNFSKFLLCQVNGMNQRCSSIEHSASAASGAPA